MIDGMTSERASSLTLPDMTPAGVIYPRPDIHFNRVIHPKYRLPTKTEEPEVFHSCFHQRTRPKIKEAGTAEQKTRDVSFFSLGRLGRGG